MAHSPSSDISESFEHAASLVRSLSSKLDTKVLLKLYAHYKQATVGPCQSSSSFTSWFGPNKMKQDAWRSLGGMSKEAAMQGYICLVASLLKTTEEGESVEQKTEDNEESDDHEGSDELESEEEEQQQERFAWVRVSRPAVSQDLECALIDEEKSLIDWAKEGSLSGLAAAIKTSTTDEINKADASGLTALHWAADRGHSEAVQLLVNAGALTNSRDLEGQTALHYAASCAHGEVIRILLKAGSDPEAVNSDGERPQDLASGEDIEDLFRKLHVIAQ
ncbi:acyl-CoA-binding domain-containing protein 6 [Hetaerina americana]|uniref:acyl-CoA-binding domain-containing protein 6 n=1 Tax=Hetaerina americana TaxID=62018 RepID=UPI003A7F104A